MKNFIYSIIFLTLCSCSSYQISTLRNVNPKNNTLSNEFIFENDSVRITYNFKGEDAPLNISVFNKLKEPLFIDWKKSALIVKDDTKSLVDGKVNFSANGTGIIDKDRSYLEYITTQKITGSASLPMDVDFVPPGATIKKQPVKIADKLFKDISSEAWGFSYLNGDNLSEAVKVKTASFNTTNTPLLFRCYLTLYTMDKQSQIKDLVSVEESFYVSEFKQTYVRPDKVSYYQEAKDSVFYVSKVKTTK